MKTHTIHPLSAAGGALVAALGLLVLGAQTPSVDSVLHPAPRPSRLVKIAGIPAPEDMVLILEENGPYTVPVGRRLVITGIGSATGSIWGPFESPLTVSLVIGGSTVLQGPYLHRYGQGMASVPPSIQPIPAGVFADAGAVVEVVGTSSDNPARLTGYLAATR